MNRMSKIKLAVAALWFALISGMAWKVRKRFNVPIMFACEVYQRAVSTEGFHF